jgi:hypothetical protein
VLSRLQGKMLYPVTSLMRRTSRISTSQQLFCKTGISVENESFLIDMNDLSSFLIDTNDLSNVSILHDLEYER